MQPLGEWYDDTMNLNWTWSWHINPSTFALYITLRMVGPWCIQPWNSAPTLSMTQAWYDESKAQLLVSPPLATLQVQDDAPLSGCIFPFTQWQKQHLLLHNTLMICSCICLAPHMSGPQICGIAYAQCRSCVCFTRQSSQENKSYYLAVQWLMQPNTAAVHG